MPNTITEAVKAKNSGFHIGQRLILPFRCQVIKLMVGGEIYTEFVGSKHVKISQDPKNTSLSVAAVGARTNRSAMEPTGTGSSTSTRQRAQGSRETRSGVG